MVEKRKKKIIQDQGLSFPNKIPYKQEESIPMCGGVCLNKIQHYPACSD